MGTTPSPARSVTRVCSTKWRRNGPRSRNWPRRQCERGSFRDSSDLEMQHDPYNDDLADMRQRDALRWCADEDGFLTIRPSRTGGRGAVLKPGWVLFVRAAL